jgi:hypothetical protein
VVVVRFFPAPPEVAVEHLHDGDGTGGSHERRADVRRCSSAGKTRFEAIEAIEEVVDGTFHRSAIERRNAGE